jgi:hypothetical protein
MEGQIDFTHISTGELIRHFLFHCNDTGAMTLEQESRRIFIVQEIGDELQRRGVDPCAPKSAWGSNSNLSDRNTVNRAPQGAN